MVRPKKEQKLIIQVKLNGEGVSPGTISILDLSAISSALQNAIAKSAAELDLSELGCPVMALTSVREGCGIFENHFKTIAQDRIIIEDIPHIAEQLNLLS